MKRMENIDDSSLKYIEKEVKAKRPVVFRTSTVNGLRWYQNKNGKLEDQHKHWSEDGGHIVTITGITEYYDSKTYERKKFVEISSWGEKYYIPYEDIEKNKNIVHIAINKRPK